MRVHQWRRQDSRSIITTLLFQIMTELSPTMVIVCQQSTLSAMRYEMGHWNAPTIAAYRKHSNLNRTLKTRHRTQTLQLIPPKGRAGGDEISRMQACTPLCMVRPLRSHLTCRTQKCAGVFCRWMSSSLSEGLAAAAKSNSTRLISTSVPCCLASWCGVVWCVVLQ